MQGLAGATSQLSADARVVVVDTVVTVVEVVVVEVVVVGQKMPKPGYEIGHDVLCG